jgi:Protein of unknown function (DUF3485)
MKSIVRAGLCFGMLAAGVAAQAALEGLTRIDRPPLRRPLSGLPMDLGGWAGKDEPIDPKILKESQATECISRTYVHPKFPGVALSLWINYSLYGTNMRHSPEICLPSQGAPKIESYTRVFAVAGPDGEEVPVSRLGYGEGELVQAVGFWYYIFGEGKIERWVRGLPVTSRSSHGRTTRGSGLTVEVFWKSEADPDSLAFRDFAGALLAGLGPIMPTDRAGYHVP